MFLTELRIENFRIFGEGGWAFVLPLKAGLTALVGENDTGKTAVIDALRLALATRDQEFFRVEETDFHQPPDGTERRKEIRIRCKFDGLTLRDKAAFAEYLTYEDRDTAKVPVLFVNWKAVATAKAVGQRRFTSVEIRSGKAADGPTFDPEARNLLCATYLRPLRDAERAMSTGRGSRLSQILQHVKEIKEHGQDYDPKNTPRPDPGTLSVLGIGDYANALLGEHKGVKSARENLNTKYLKHLSFSGSRLEGHISVSGSRGETSVRLRQLLEKLELALRDEDDPEGPSNRGLGSNNLLFMACELLLLGSEEEGFPLLLIEEPEAHLHPQRQLRLMQFLQTKANEARTDDQKIQIIVTTHSPNLASTIELDNLVLLQGGKAFPLAFGHTELEKSDYGFLKRFLDVTKANMFFARGLLIVEGDAENILLPTLAHLLGRDLTENGVSIINVGGTGLRRFARIYQRKHLDKDGMIDVPVACVTDLDVMPDCAAEIIEKVKPKEKWPEMKYRRWRAKADFKGEELEERRKDYRAKASGQKVETFVSNEWTFEYDLAFFGLAEEVWIAAHLAKSDDQINAQKTTVEKVAMEAATSYAELSDKGLSKEELASRVLALFVTGSEASKAVAAQYLAGLLEARIAKGELSPKALRAAIPPYIAAAIDHVTTEKQPEPAKKQEGSSGE